MVEVVKQSPDIVLKITVFCCWECFTEFVYSFVFHVIFKDIHFRDVYVNIVIIKVIYKRKCGLKIYMCVCVCVDIYMWVCTHILSLIRKLKSLVFNRNSNWLHLMNIKKNQLKCWYLWGFEFLIILGFYGLLNCRTKNVLSTEKLQSLFINWTPNLDSL